MNTRQNSHNMTGNMFVAVHLVVVVLFGLMTGHTSYSLTPPSAPNYETRIACEGGQLQLNCDEGTKINLIRANFGRFSISICNTQGNLEWSVNCMARKSFRVIQEVCGNRSECLLFASASYFGDPCPGVNKYLEVHYQCLPESNMKQATGERRTAGRNFTPSKQQQQSNQQANQSKQQPILVSAASTRSDSDAARKDVSSISTDNNSNSNINNINNNKNIQLSNTSSPALVTTTAAPVVVPNFFASLGEAEGVSASSQPSAAPVPLVPITETGTESPPLAAPTSSSSSLSASAASGVQEQRGSSSSGSSSSNRSNNNLRVSSESSFDQVLGNGREGPSRSGQPSHPAVDPVSDDDDYSEGGTSSSQSEETGNSAALPLSEHLRLLLTIGGVFAVICLFLTMLSLVLTAFPATSSLSHHSQHHVTTHQHHYHNHHHQHPQQVQHQSRSWRLELQVRQNLTLCLLLVEILFLIGINLSQSRFFCGIISGTLHYFFLSIFIWLFFDGFTLYLALLKQQEQDAPPSTSSLQVISSSCASSSKNKPSRCYLWLAYGLPLLIQTVSSLLDTGSFLISSSPTHCWLRSDKFFVLTFVGPVIAVLSANFLFLAITVVCSNYGSLFNFDKGSPFPTAASLATESSLRCRLRTSLAVFVVMSLTLTALFVSLCQELPEDQLVFTSCLYVFAILNPIQVLVLVVLFSSSSSVARYNTFKVLTSLGFLSDSKSNDHPMHGCPRFKDGILITSSAAAIYHNTQSNADAVGSQQPEPMIPLPHASTLNLADIGERERSLQAKAYAASDYGFRRSQAALNYRSPVYASSAATASRVRSGHGHVHTKQCLQFPCQFPHVVEHVYESIDEDPYIARLLMPVSTPLIGRKAGNGSASASLLPAIIRDNTNHSTIICSSSLAAAARVSNIKSHLVNSQCQPVQQQQQHQQQIQVDASEAAAAAAAAKLRQESTLI